eukprot:gb/GECG01011603.1/.p1 GENE.gb/GECG01011603.1/~~gb/GECG01011603.1/.p1  ORF type:complete len:570 (+),score=61.64 gb/GECG01011603.1/:1-1710(+)
MGLQSGEIPRGSIYFTVGALAGSLIMRLRKNGRQREATEAKDISGGEEKSFTFPPYENTEHWTNPEKHKRIVQAILEGQFPSSSLDTKRQSDDEERYKRERLEQKLQGCSQDEWVFFAEGAVNVIFQYVGQDEELYPFVLRVPKLATSRSTGNDFDPTILSPYETFRDFMQRSTRPPGLPDSVTEAVRSHGLFPRDTQEFHENVVKPLVHRNYTPSLLCVRLPTALLRTLSRKLENIERKGRRGTIYDAEEGCSPAHGYLVTDATKTLQLSRNRKNQLSVSQAVGSGICMEIKPKSGTLASGTDIMRGRCHHPLQQAVSRFEMHQYWKWREGKIPSMSSFRPQLLFSNRKQGIKRSLATLCENPQNNLRIVAPPRSTVGEALTSAGCYPQHSCEQSLSKFQDTVADILLQEPLLQLIITVQHESASEVQAFEAFREVLDSQRAATTASPAAAGVDLHDLYTDSVAVSKGIRLKKYQGKTRKTLRSFLVGKSFKDCSIMLSLQRVNTRDIKESARKSIGNDFGYLPEADGNYGWLYRPLLIDTDMRDIHCIPYYDFMEKEIIRHYLGEVH